MSSDREFLAVARRRLGALFPKLPRQPGFHKRRHRLTETIEWLIGVFAADCPGHADPVVLLDSTPVECGRSLETVRRSELADACGYGYRRSHSRWFWGMRLHLCCAPDGTHGPRSSPPPTNPSARWRFVLPKALHGGEQIVCDKGYAGREFAAEVEARFAAEVLRPNRRDEAGTSPALSMIRQRIESVFWTLKDRLGLERHRARTLSGLRARIASKPWPWRRAFGSTAWSGSESLIYPVRRLNVESIISGETGGRLQRIAAIHADLHSHPIGEIT